VDEQNPPAHQEKQEQRQRVTGAAQTAADKTPTIGKSVTALRPKSATI
jgi:hypothetical protein